jgi:hypothetical protein
VRNDDYSDVRNTLGVALVLWAAFVTAGTHAEIFARLPVEVLVALATYATAFAIAAVTWDVHLRQWLDERRGLVARLAMLGAALAIAAGARYDGARLADLGAAPWAPLLIFGLPVTAALFAAAAGAAWRASAGAFRSPASTAPARRPAAT